MQTEFKKPPSHKTFIIGSTIISSDFDSGNLVNA